MKIELSKAVRAALLAAVLTCLPAALLADAITADVLAPGYQSTSIELGQPFGGAVAQHPDIPNLLYVSYGNYADHRIMSVEIDSGTTRTVTPLVGNVGGLAVLTNGDLAITDNDNFLNDTLLRARDLNGDGDFLDAGEITELIAPILMTSDNFTGAQMVVAPANNGAQIPEGSLILQTADGGTSAELLVIENPGAAPAYRPANSPFYGGFMYNGGVGFTPEGHVLCGISEFPTGKVNALVNTNGDMDIDAGEVHTVIDSNMLPNSISDIGTTADGKVITAENSGTVRMFQLPVDLLSGSATPGTLAATSATYVSTVRVDFPGRPFSSVAGPRATVYVGGYVTFPAATNLLAITPVAPASVEEWKLFE